MASAIYGPWEKGAWIIAGVAPRLLPLARDSVLAAALGALPGKPVLEKAGRTRENPDEN